MVQEPLAGVPPWNESQKSANNLRHDKPEYENRRYDSGAATAGPVMLLRNNDGRVSSNVVALVSVEKLYHNFLAIKNHNVTAS